MSSLRERFEAKYVKGEGCRMTKALCAKHHRQWHRENTATIPKSAPPKLRAALALRYSIEEVQGG